MNTPIVDPEWMTMHDDEDEVAEAGPFPAEYTPGIRRLPICE
jgi:hypothetical protein